MKAAGPASTAMSIVVISIISWILISCVSVRVPSASYGIRASDDPNLVERGRYLVCGPAHCSACHGDPARESDMRQRRDVPLSGGRRFDVGLLGTIVAPNITSDRVAGIGALSDDTLVRSLRYDISRDGRPLAPFMPFADLTDEDLQAILSFLRTTPPVAQPAPANDLSWVGAFAMKFVLDPQGPATPPRSRHMPVRDAEYGRYLAHTVANCYGCHTRRSRLTGAFVGAPFAGGLVMKEANGTFITPNLTPIATGVMSGLTEQEFIERFRVEGRRHARSPMPWEAFARMTEVDLAAIYRYLNTLSPTESRSGTLGRVRSKPSSPREGLR